MNGTAAAFEGLAENYDCEFGRNLVFGWMRRRVRDELLTRLEPQSRVLDFGCGTGLDALMLAGEGHDVIAADGSPAMLCEVERKRQKHDLGAFIETRRVDFNDVSSRRTFFRSIQVDAVLSNFGALNCANDLTALAADMRLCLPIGGCFLAVVMSRLYPTEIVYHLWKRRWQRAFQRLERGPIEVDVAGTKVPVRYYHPVEFCESFSPWFRRLHVTALGVLLPPPYLSERASREGIDLEWLEWLDKAERRWGHRWPLRALGDHFLAVLERCQ